MTNNLHDTFLEQLDSLPIQRKFAEKEPKTLFGTLTPTEQKNYLCDIVGIGEHTFISWKRKKSVIVPKVDSLLLMAQHFHVSVDYLLGNCESPQDYTEHHIHTYTGLSYDAIARLHEWKKDYDEKDKSFFHMLAMSPLEALNIILEDNYKQEKTEGLKWGVLDYIADYLISDEMVREEGKPYFWSGENHLELKEGDVVTKSDSQESFVVSQSSAITQMTNDNKKIGLHKENNYDKRKIVPIATLFRANAIICIEKILFKISERRKNNILT